MQTKDGHPVEVVSGRPDEIMARGEQIHLLGRSMQDAATTLGGLKDGTIVGVGGSVDKIKETVGDVVGDLDEAGRRYEPAGTVLKDYAAALETAQTHMKTIVADCEDSLAALSRAEDEASNAAEALTAHTQAVRDNPPAPDQADSSTATGQTLSGEATSAQTALGTAQREHDGNLSRFETEYDTWERAYEKAVNDLEDANNIGKDSRWENIAGVLAVISDWVGWIGLALAVLGLIIGGPFFAIAALVVGVIALALTIALMFDGRKGWGDLAWSIVGILPIGKLGKVFSGKAKFVDEFVNQFRNPYQQMRGMRNFADSGIDYASRGFRQYYAGAAGVRRHGINPVTGFVDGLTERLLFGPGRSFSVAFHESVDSAGPYFQNLLKESLPKGLQSAADAPSFSTWEATWNAYRWADRGVSVTTNGKPSGTVSPSGLLNGLLG